VVLQLKKLGIDDLVHFDFMDPPGRFGFYPFYIFHLRHVRDVARVPDFCVST
jgi:hypothetical protein